MTTTANSDPPSRAHPSRKWWQTAVVYQLYVRSFADADGDGIGDLAGIRDRLDHVASLGADAIWLNPCYPSPQRDHGYDVSDYFDINPDYGTLADLDALIAAADARGIKVVMDVVANHCSTEHEWFAAAVAAGRGSPERERFWFADGRGEAGAEPPNNWQAIFGGPAWTRVTEPDGTPGQWYLGVFTPHQPDFNWHHPDVGDHFDRMLRFWFDRGVAGFRADAVTVLGKAPGLPDHEGPQSFGHASPQFDHQPDGHLVWRRWRRVVDDYNAEHPDRDVFLVAEAYTFGRHDIFLTYVNDEEFHQGFSFDLLLCGWRAQDMHHAIEEVVSTLPAAGLTPAWALNNHDVERAVTRYGRPSSTSWRDPAGGNLVYPDEPVDVQLGRRRATAAAAMMLALPGAAYLYMGEELGLPEVLDLPDEVRQDPLFHLTDGAMRGRDGCRIPLPWSTDPSGAHGFSPPTATAEPWLPQPLGWGRMAPPNPVLDIYRAAIAARRTQPDLADHALAWLDGPAGTVAFRRGSVTVVMNMTAAPVDVADLRGDYDVLLCTTPLNDPDRLPPDTCAWFGTAAPSR